MKDKIIETAIESLRNEGLKFSVDTVASKLKISKKTIYNFFPNKENLAYAIYEKYYGCIFKTADEIAKSGNNEYISLLTLYWEASFMIRGEIFNKYKLNDCVYSYVIKLQNELWSRIICLISLSSSQDEKNALKAIIDGSFENGIKNSVPPEAIIEKLVKIL